MASPWHVAGVVDSSPSEQEHPLFRHFDISSAPITFQGFCANVSCSLRAPRTRDLIMEDDCGGDDDDGRAQLRGRPGGCGCIHGSVWLNPVSVTQKWRWVLGVGDGVGGFGTAQCKQLVTQRGPSHRMSSRPCWTALWHQTPIRPQPQRPVTPAAACGCPAWSPRRWGTIGR